MPRFTIRQKLGALLYDVPRFAAAVRGSAPDGAAAPWVFMRNRSERLEPGPGMRGARCLWQWTSRLHVADVFPWAGRRLLRRALEDWPIELADRPARAGGVPDISFVIGHRGRARLPLLLETLRSIAGQRDVAVECVVVEQSETPEVRDELPRWVKWVHDPCPGDMPYNRARTFNVGTDTARSDFLVFHDNDMLVPREYAREMLRLVSEGWEIINLKRFIFYLDEAATRTIVDRRTRLETVVPDHVIQNLEAGGSAGGTREALEEIGGWDEGFVGWGGEDNEFWERALTRRAWEYGYLPIVHLWHAPQAGKGAVNVAGVSRYHERALVGPEIRIRELRERHKVQGAVR